MNWLSVMDKEKFESKGRRAVFKYEKKQIALLGAEDGEVFAVDNRCPHQGYPLSQGSVDGNCVLTCQWHNWKFDLKSGECKVGGDNVRAYPVRFEGDDIQVGVSEPTKEEIQEDILKGLKVAFEKHQTGRITREITRLMFNDIDPLCAVSKAIEWSHDKLQYGMTHAYAATADWLTRYFQEEGNQENQVIALFEAVDHIALDVLRHPVSAFPETTLPFEGDGFLEAIEDEDEVKATQLVLGALEQGKKFEELEIFFVKATLRHYNNFGHSAIYVYKVRQLIEHLGSGCEKFLILALTRHLCYTTREDLIPDFKDFAPLLKKIQSKELNLSLQTEGDNQIDIKELRPLSANQAMQFVEERISTSSCLALYESLLQANGWNFLNFDESHMQKIDVPASGGSGWLSVTHGITFANAVRALCSQYPQFWPEALLQMAAFVGRNNVLTKDQTDEVEPDSSSLEEFKKSSLEKIYDHGQPDPIYSCHLLKTFQAVVEECEGASSSTANILMRAYKRYLHAPYKYAHARRRARQAVALVSKDF